MLTNKFFKLDYLEQFAGNSFIIYRENENGEEIFTYAELLRVVENVSHQFASIKLISLPSFALDLDASIDGIAVLISILNYGGHFCIVPKEANNQFLEACEANYLLSTHPDVTKRFCQLKLRGEIIVRKVKLQLYIFDGARTMAREKPLDLCYTITTTGTTGSPKVVHVPYTCIAPNISGLCEKFGLTYKDVIYLGTPLTFDPSVVELFMALATGSTILLTPTHNRNDTDLLVDILWPRENRTAVSVLQMTPTNFRRFGVSNIKQNILASTSKLRILILGGEEFPRHTELKTWLQKPSETSVKIFNIYGITELSCWSTICEWLPSSVSERTPIGAPIDSSTLVRIVRTTDGQVIDDCGKGELLVGSACRKTYIPQIDGNGMGKNIGDVLYRSTGDLVERSVTGDIFYVARLSDSIKRFGKRISLSEIEHKLECHLSSFGGLRIVLLWHEAKQSLICCLKVADKKQITEAKKIILQNASEQEKPDQFVVVEKLPLDRHEKLDRRSLLQLAMTNSCLQKPIEIFQTFLNSVLQIDLGFTPSDRKRLKYDSEILKSFTAAGGSSFQALALASEIGEQLADPNDQRLLLKMLLTDASIFEVCNFLSGISFKETDPEETERPTTANALAKNTKHSLKLSWRVYMNKCVDATPALGPDNNSICIGSHARIFLNIQLDNGDVLTKVNLRDRIECQAAFVSNDFALIGCNTGFLYGIDILSGRIEYSIYIGKQVKAKPLLVDESLAIIGCYEPLLNLAGVCLKKREVKWRKRIGNRPIYASPILLDSKSALVCTLDGSYECLNVDTSQTIWKKELASPIFSTPKKIECGKEFIVAEVQGKIHVCQNESGLILQSFHCDGNIFSSIQCYQREGSNLHIIFGCHDHYVYCLEYNENKQPKTQKSCVSLTQKWKRNLESAVFSTPAVFELLDEIFIAACSSKGSLVVLEYLTGRIVCDYSVDNEVFSSICCQKTKENSIKIIFGCRDDFVYCFEYN